MRSRIFLAALGVALSVILSALAEVPAMYNIGSISPAHLFLVPLLAQVAILAVLLALWLGKPVRRPAALAAFLMAIQLAASILSRPNDQGMLLLWLFGELLHDFAWIVLLVLFVRESKPLECKETHHAALLLAISTLASTLGYAYILSGSWRFAHSEFFWLLPDGTFWKTASVAVSAAIHLGSAATLVYFLVGVFGSPTAGNSPLDT